MHRKLIAHVTLTLCALPLATPTASARAEERTREVVIFDAEVHDCRVFGLAPGEGADPYRPHCRRVSPNGEYLVEFSYTGTHGRARVSFTPSKRPPAPPGTVFCGIKLLIDYPKDDFRHLRYFIRYADKTYVGGSRALEEGRHDVVITGGWRKAAHPPRWDQLKSITLNAFGEECGPGFTFYLKRICLLARPRNPERVRVLRLGPARNVKEVLPATSPITADGRSTESAWRRATELPGYHYYKGPPVAAPNSPFRVKAAYDDKNLYLLLRSEFPTPPRAVVKKQDARVFSDEPQEIFFSAANDDDQKIQFAMNHAGTVFDYVREFDLAAQKVLTKMERNVAHTKGIRYENGLWTTEIAFPLSSIGFDPDRARHMGFQVAQNYLSRREQKLRTLAWNKTTFFPAPTQFGLLVFNRKPFGPGAVEVHQAGRAAREASTVDFTLRCTLKDFRPGTYRAVSTLVVRGRSKTHEERLSIGADGTLSRTFKVPGVWNEEGTYMWYLAIVNAQNDHLVVPVNFTNVRDLQDQFGRRLLLPKPKQLVWGESEFPARKNDLLFLPQNATARTRKTAGIFKKKYFGYTGVTLAERTFAHALPRRGVVLRIARSATYQNRDEKLQREGYCLVVEPTRVLITGADEPGLYYGTITLFQLFRNSMKITQDIPVPCAEILDWPDLPIRLCRLENYSGRSNVHKEVRGIDYLIDWTDRWVAAGKLNLLMVDLSAAVRYRRHPEVNNGSDAVRYSFEELQRFAQYCRDNFIDLCPAWQIGGHEGCWLLRSHPEFAEKGWPGTGNLAHPERKQVVFDCMLDVIEALKPKYLSPKGDEYWHHKKKAKEKPDELLYGKTRAQAFLDFHLELHGWLKRQGIKMAMYHDMLSPYHNGTRCDVYKVVDKLPRDIAIMVWSGLDKPKQIAYFADRGFPVWLNGTSIVMALTPKTRKQISGSGQSIYNFGHDRAKQGGGDEMIPWRSMYSVLRGADYAWNSAVDDGESWHAQIGSGRLVTMRHIFAVRENPYAGELVTPIDIAAQLNESLGAFLRDAKPETYPGDAEAIVLPTGQQEVGFVPMQFAAREGRNAVILRKGTSPVGLPVRGAHSSIIFLHGGFVNDPENMRHLFKWPYGTPCGDYVVHYADGTKETVPLRMHTNIKSIDGKSANRATLDNRYVLTLKDRNRNNIHFQQLEWVNPRPRTQIEKIVVAHDGHYDVSLILLSVSGRSIAHTAKSTPSR